jgi:dipeptidyl-peptidase-4
MENTEPESIASVQPPRLTLEAIYTDKIFETTLPRQLHWMQDSKRFSYLDTLPGTEVSTIWLYDTQIGHRTPIIALKALQLPSPESTSSEETDPTGKVDGAASMIAIRGYQWSPDETRLLLANLPQRRAAHGDKTLYVYTLATGELRKVADSEYEHRNAKWSPDGKQLGYVRNDDIYLLDLATGVETRLTSTPSPAVYNGRFGWVYEEELELADGWAFSPDGRYLSYYQVDETAVPLIDLPDYTDLHMKPVQMR